MKLRSLIIAGCVLGAALVRAEPGPAQPAAAPPPAVDMSEEPSEEALEQTFEAARAALEAIDAERLTRDRDYAAEILRHVETIDANMEDDPDVRAGLQILRQVAMVTLGRGDEVRRSVENAIARRPRQAGDYAVPIAAARALRDHALLVAVVETASRNVPGVGWVALRRLLDRDFMFPMFHELTVANQHDLRARLAGSLFRIGWPGDGDIDATDGLRMILVKERLRQGDRAAAADLAAGLTSPGQLLPLLVMREYDALFESDADRIATLNGALSRFDRQTAENMAGDGALPFVLDRSRYLRAVGRDREALELLLPHTRDVAATVAAHDYGMWIVNQAVYVLLALDRDDEAVALMERLLALPVAENVSLIGPYINHAAVLHEAGRHEQALAYAQALERDHGRFANDYGRSVIASRMVCALAELDRAAEAAPIVERMRAGGDRNLATLMTAYICLGDMDAAEAVVIRRLQGDEAVGVVMSFQDYEIRPEQANPDPMEERQRSLRERPAVRAAIERVGRLMSLPLASAAWSGL